MINLERRFYAEINVPFRLSIRTKGSLKNNLADLAPGFRSDLAVSIEQNHRNNSIISRILRLRNGRRWPEDGMQKCEAIFERALCA